MTGSAWEDYIALQIQEAGLPEPVREYQFHEPQKGEKQRKWRFDFAWPDHKFALEVDGSVFHKGGHTTGKGYTDGCEKVAHALIQGYKVMRVTTGQVSQGKAITWVKEYFRRQVTK